jgi:acyl-coenzyme A synthetase/AMP-(fatty) acid ligase
VEDLIATMPGVIDVVVSAEANAITGNLVKAEVQLAGDEARADFRARMNAYLADRLPPFKIPQKVVVTRDSLSTARLKKKRS